MPPLIVLALVLGVAWYFECSETHAKRQMVGRWRGEMVPRLVLELRSDGTFDYGREDRGWTTHGAWSLDHGDLVLASPDQTLREPARLATSRGCEKSGLMVGHETYLPVDGAP